MAPKTAAEKKAAAKKAKPDQKDPVKAAQDKKDQSNMVTQLKKADTPAKCEALKLYQSLPRFSEEKAEMLKKWKLDKSCKWISSYQESRKLTQVTTHQEKDGFATKHLGIFKSLYIKKMQLVMINIVFFPASFLLRYKVAELCNLPVESPEMQKILAELPQDDEWDESVGLERGYKKAGLTRYHLVGLKDFSTRATQDSYTEEAKRTKTSHFSQSGSVQLSLAQPVKDENPLRTALAQKVAVAESGKMALERVKSQIQDYQVVLTRKFAKDSSWKVKKAEIDKSLSKLQDESLSLRQEIEGAKELQPSEVTQEILDKFTMVVENASTLVDVAKSQVKQVSGLLGK